MTLPEIYTVAHNIHRAFICTRRKKVLLFVPAEKMGPSRDTTHFTSINFYKSFVCRSRTQSVPYYNNIRLQFHTRQGYTRHCNNTIGAITHIIHIQYCLASFSINSHHTSKGQLSKTGNEWGIDK
jgi:hypothetical protein